MSDYYNSDFYRSSSSYDVPTLITLNKIPSSIYAGETVVFSGNVIANGNPLGNVYVKILEDDPFVPDQLLGKGFTDSNGIYSITWKTSAGLVEDDFDVYAVFDGDSIQTRQDAKLHHDRTKTCLIVMEDFLQAGLQTLQMMIILLTSMRYLKEMMYYTGLQPVMITQQNLLVEVVAIPSH